MALMAAMRVNRERMFINGAKRPKARVKDNYPKHEYSGVAFIEDTNRILD
jgi:hypothetical protein